MPLDQLAKRFFPAVVMLLIAIAAYFQASGVMQLVASSYLDSAPAPAPLARSARTTLAIPPDAAAPKSAEPILSRNPFDSVTGPLNKVVDTSDPTVAQTPQLDLSNPLSAPDCGGVQAHAIT